MNESRTLPVQTPLAFLTEFPLHSHTLVSELQLSLVGHPVLLLQPAFAVNGSRKNEKAHVVRYKGILKRKH